MSRIPITGIGIVAPGAIGVGAFRSLLEGGLTAIAEIDRFDTEGLSAHKAGLIRDFKARDYIAPMKMRRMNTLSRYGVAAARLAIDDAAADPALLGTTGVALGTSFGPVQTSVEYMQEYVEKGAALAPPQLFAESVANAPGSHIAIEWGFRGFNITVTQRESSALAAAMYAASQLVKGSVDSAAIGGVEEVNEMLFSVLDRIGSLAHRCAGLEEAMRPMDRRRNGILIGEGGAVVLCGRSAGQNVYAWFSGFGIARDTTATISDWGEGEGAVVEAMRRAIDDAELMPADIDAVYASANGSIRGDRLESLALQKLFGTRMPPVVATKSYFGEYAAGGALQLAAAILAIRDQVLHASPGFDEPDPGMRFEPNRVHRAAKIDHVLVNSLSAGGGIVSAVLSREAA
ncbi:MAG: beta-ketoacyl synthase N-terminal-like domain-containing protein [Thermoanaerobaculia bacterium]